MGSLTTVRTDYEAHFLLQNLMLTGEALRLGGWVHGAPMIPHVWKRDPAAGVLGLGFREYSAKTFDSRWKRWPPVPASQPNYVGIDGVLEGLCPPYVNDMDAAVDQVLEEKFGPGGTYQDAEVFAQSYKDKATAETYMKHAGHPPAEAIEYTKEICRYLVDTYGRFPAHTDAFHLPGIWVQFSHLEIEYYEQYASERHIQRQREGREIWERRVTGGNVARSHDRPHAVHADPQALAVGAVDRAARDPRTRFMGRHILQFNFIKFVRWTVVPSLDGERLNYPYLFFETNFDGPWQHYIDAFAYVIPKDIRLTWGRGPGFPHPPPAEPLKAWIAINSMEGGTYYCAHADGVDADGEERPRRAGALRGAAARRRRGWRRRSSRPRGRRS